MAIICHNLLKCEAQNVPTVYRKSAILGRELVEPTSSFDAEIWLYLRYLLTYVTGKQIGFAVIVLSDVMYRS